MTETKITENMWDEAAKWSVTDFYPECERKLRELISSGEDFDTGYFGCRREPRTARICRAGGKLTVEVSVSMDSLYEEDDLIYDALFEVYGVEELLPDEVLTRINDLAIEFGLNDYSEESETLPSDAPFEKVVEAMERLEKGALVSNEDMYHTLCNIVRNEAAELYSGLDASDKN